MTRLLAFLYGVIQHSVMARPGFKQWWKRFMPPPIERSSYVLFASAALILMFWLWKPITQEVWHIHMPAAVFALWVMFAFGWGVVLSCTLLIDKASLHQRVPAAVLERQNSFVTCDQCHRAYWDGSHWRHMREFLRAIVDVD